MLSGNPRSAPDCGTAEGASLASRSSIANGLASENSAAVPRRTLVLGMGNDILTDDAIGLAVVRRLESQLQRRPDTDFRVTSEMGLALLDFITGYSRVILIDSIQTGHAPAGFVHELDAGSLPDSSVLRTGTPHFLGVSETLALGRQLGLAMPEEVRVLAIEVEDPYTVSETMTPTLQRALSAIVDQAARALALPNP